MMNHAGRTRYRHAQREFSRFVHCAEHELRRHLEAAERGKELELAYSVYVSPEYVGREGRPYSKFPSTLEIRCGVAPIGRLTPEGKMAEEGDLGLVYSLGPTGHV